MLSEIFKSVFCPGAVRTKRKDEEKNMSIKSCINRTKAFIKSRKGSAMLLASASLAASIFISSHISVVSVVDGENLSRVITAKGKSSVDIIRQAGFALSDNDTYAVNGADSPVREIEIIRAFDMKVIDGGAEKTVSAVSGTVAEALENAGIALPEGEDKINVSLDSEVDENITIIIDRVKYVTQTKTKAVTYKTVTKKDPNLAEGKTKVSVKGVNGEKKITTVKKYVNGKLTDTDVKEKLTKKAIDKVVLKGAKKATVQKNASAKITTVSENKGGRTITVNGRKISYSKVLTGSGTAYTARKGSLTATGKTVKVGRVAVDPRKIPYGTRLYIVSADGRYTYGYAVAADTGGALRSGRALVDLFYNTERECVSFGRRQVKVYILD